MRLWNAVLAGLQIMSGGAFLTELIGAKWFGLFVLAVAALQGGTVAYSKPDQAKRPQIHQET